MDNCIFCQIARNEIPCLKIYEDDKYLAFLDINPLEQGHTLVIPKQHYDLVWDVEDIGEYFEICKAIALHFRAVSNNEFVYSFIHGKGVPHAHIHIIPSENEGFGDGFSKALNTFIKTDHSSEDLSSIADKYKLT